MKQKLENFIQLNPNVLFGEHNDLIYLGIKLSNTNSYYNYVGHTITDSGLNIFFDNTYELQIYSSYLGTKYKVLYDSKTLFINEFDIDSPNAYQIYKKFCYLL